MAKKSNNSNMTSINSFEKGVVTDVRDGHLDASSWTFARNAINNTHIGDLGSLPNEPGNLFCSAAPYTVNGIIHKVGSQWFVFSTNDVDSEIGLFDEALCQYTTLANDQCLNFKTHKLIRGASRANHDCSYTVYFADDLNPDRALKENAIPWVQNCTDSNGASPGGCITCVDTDVLDCDKLRLEFFIQTPCITVRKGASAGNILNGSYYAQVAYVINGQRATDYFTMSNVLSVFTHDDVNGSLDITIDNLDSAYENYELVIISTVAGKTVAKSLGNYSTNQNKVTLDFIDPTLTSVTLTDLTISNPVVERSEGIFSVDKYLFRTGVTSKLDFNYQPLANQITTKWQCVEYNKNYYKNAGTNVGYMRDEVYSFFIRWVYTTGDKSKSYHIPGRGPRLYTTPDVGTVLENADYVSVNPNNLENIEGLTSRVFEMYNTASVSATPNTSLPDGGVIIAEGDMGYWESSEYYDDKHPEIWNSNINGRTDLDLCGTPIRHHKFPENSIYAGSGISPITNHYANGGQKIRIMGVEFDNIQAPLDNSGSPIANIVGYEILRGSRNGNKTVLYKGLLNNMFKYNIDVAGSSANKTGLYPNYPFNDLSADPFISKTATSWETAGGYTGIDENDQYSRKHFTFHSPDTMFNKPFLSQKEIKIYGNMFGEAVGSFVTVDNHPKHKFVNDATFYVGVVAGIGYAITQTIGKKTTSIQQPYFYQEPLMIGTSSSSPSNPIATTTATAALATANATYTLANQGTPLLDAVLGTNVTALAEDAKYVADLAIVSAAIGSGYIQPVQTVTYEDNTGIPWYVRIAQGVPMFKANVTQGIDTMMNLIRSISPYKQFALQYQSYSAYENFAPTITGNRRRYVNDAKYLDSHIQNYDANYTVNNLQRNKTVMFDTASDVIDPIISDTTRRKKASDLPDAFDEFASRASSHYGALKSRLRNQYGKLYNIKQLPVSTCLLPVASTSTGTLFGGDTYIGRYQEKNTFYYFYKWLLGEPNGEELNYHLYDMVRHTTYWMDTEPFDTADFTQSIGTALQTAIANIGSGGFSTFFTNLVTPSDKHCMDRLGGNNGFFMLKRAYIYLFNSGLRDFFVESELNVDYRDHGDEMGLMHWDIIQDRRKIFNSSIITAGNYYKLDQSLSVSYLPFTKASWAVMQDQNYSPLLADTCYTKYAKRVLYSLPQDNHLIADNWSVYLANNYQDFNSKITGITGVGLTGIMLFFENNTPVMYPGVDELQLKSGTSITIGDGGLFARAPQNVFNADDSYQYGSCQNTLSIVNTPAGIFFASLDQGKVFSFNSGLKEISLKNNNYWFNQYLPYQLTQDFPNYDLLDNPVAGLGCQLIYDSEWAILYIMKRDFRLKDAFKGKVEYIGNGDFLVNRITKVKTGDPLYFDNASWTVSYDPKKEEEIAWHDWHPNLCIAGKNAFLTIKGKNFWRHNTRCDLYCNYYGIDYPYEIEVQIDNMPAVTILNSIEYYMDVFTYGENCRDRFHVLDFNFDEAVVYNSEQTSGILKLNLAPKNDVVALAGYPKVTPVATEILYTKKEQKYRFNQFWDVIRDRGEFSPTVQEKIWITEHNGYIKNLNPLSLQYNKPEFQRKKIRHYNNRLILRRNVCGNKNMLMHMTSIKLTNSPR